MGLDMACSFCSSALLLGNTSIRMDRTTSTALANTGTASCLLLFTRTTAHQGGKKQKRIYFTVQWLCDSVLPEGKGGGQHARSAAAGLKGREERRGSPRCPHLALCSPCTQFCLARDLLCIPSTAQAQDSTFGGNQGTKRWDCTTAPWRVFQRNSASFQMQPLVLAQPLLPWASPCFWKRARSY